MEVKHLVWNCVSAQRCIFGLPLLSFHSHPCKFEQIRQNNFLHVLTLKKVAFFAHDLKTFTLKPVNLALYLLPNKGLSVPVGKRDSLSFGVTREYHRFTKHELGVGL